MSRGFQKIIIMGSMGKDPEVRNTQNGKTIASFSVAVNGYKDQTEWFNIVCFEKLAEIAQQYLKKGNQVLLEGVMQTQSWDDKSSGQKRYKTELLASNLTLMGNGDSKPSEAPTKAKKEWDEDTTITDDDIPF